MTATSPAASPAADHGETVLEVRDLHTHFNIGGGLLSPSSGVVRAIDGVTFDVKRGEIFGLVGESGSGKTTLGRSILGLAPATSGQIMWKGHDLAQLTERQFRPLRRQLSMVFQDPNASLNPAMTIVQGVGHPLRIHGITHNRAQTRAKVAEMLERCGLAPADRFLDIYPEDLSGGQKQRIVIARALITNPELVVADEPVSALDMSVRAKVLELMLDLKDEFGLTYIYITHDLASGRFVCDRIGIMYLGQMVEWGDAKAIYDSPEHPYTRSLLNAIPLPDPSRRGRDKRLPQGEIPDALTPPTGCRFHPRCPEGFEPCGWQGADLVDFFERRWTQVDADVFERELGVTGPLEAAAVDRYGVRFAAPDSAGLVTLLQRLREEKAGRVFSRGHRCHRRQRRVVVQLGEGPEPALQRVGPQLVACHLHGIVRVTIRQP